LKWLIVIIALIAESLKYELVQYVVFLENGFNHLNQVVCLGERLRAVGCVEKCGCFGMLKRYGTNVRITHVGLIKQSPCSEASEVFFRNTESNLTTAKSTKKRKAK
jgi:hypothetical protein